MKTLIKSVAMLAVISLTACGSDSLQEQLEAETWVVATGVISDCDDPTENETQAFNTSPCAAGTSSCEYWTFTFSNGVVTSRTTSTDGGEVDSDQETGTYAVGDDDILTLCFDGECNSGPASVDGDNATLSFLNIEDDGCTLTINLVR